MGAPSTYNSKTYAEGTETKAEEVVETVDVAVTATFKVRKDTDVTTLRSDIEEVLKKEVPRQFSKGTIVEVTVV
jgi:hypothetical protein